MTGPGVTSFVATTYVRDLGAARTFYAALGFVEQSHGENALSAWSLLAHQEHEILLATSDPPLEIPALPLLFYFYVTDLDRTLAALAEVGHVGQKMGQPPHARGGEARVADPDGNTILIGQREPTDGQPPGPDVEPGAHFSLLREAATLAQHRAGARRACEVYDRGQPCPRPAEVKLADSWGDTAWACIPHAEELLINSTGAFIASQEPLGLGPFLAARRHP